MVSVRNSVTPIGCGMGICIARLFSGLTRGEEPADGFLNARCAEGYYDATLLYLDRMDGSRLVSKQFQSEIAYQRGVTMVQAATLMRDPRPASRC